MFMYNRIICLIKLPPIQRAVQFGSGAQLITMQGGSLHEAISKDGLVSEAHVSNGSAASRGLLESLTLFSQFPKLGIGMSVS